MAIQAAGLRDWPRGSYPTLPFDPSREPYHSTRRTCGFSGSIMTSLSRKLVRKAGHPRGFRAHQYSLLWAMESTHVSLALVLQTTWSESDSSATIYRLLARMSFQFRGRNVRRSSPSQQAAKSPKTAHLLAQHAAPSPPGSLRMSVIRRVRLVTVKTFFGINR